MAKLWHNIMFPIYLPSKSTAVSLLQLLGKQKTILHMLILPNVSTKWHESSCSLLSSRNRKEDIDAVEFEFDSSSEDSGSDNLSRSLSNDSSKAWDAVSLDSSSDQSGSWPTRDMLGYLYLQYNETSPPCSRVPFAEKVDFN